MNCNCNQTTSISPLYGAQDIAHSCIDRPTQIILRTVVIPAGAGTDADNGAFAPKPGAYYNTIVKYQATDDIYIYDSNGIYSLLSPEGYKELKAKVAGLDEALTALELKEQEDVDNLQENINQLANKEAEDVENLQININKEVNAREAAIIANQAAWEKANAELNERIDDVVNSPDVRFIVDSYTALEAIDKTSVGDQDYARVLQDETHEGASTYYQFNKATNSWTYIGEVGSYYTKQQIDDMIGDIESLLTNLDTGEGVE